MDQRKAAIFIVVGAILIYMGVFGTSGFAINLFAVTNPESYLSYTEVDPNNRITIVDATHLVHIARMDEDAYLYRDLGSFSDFTHKVQIRISAAGASGINWAWAVVNQMPWKGFDIIGCSDTGIGVMFYDFASTRQIRLYFGSPRGASGEGSVQDTYIGQTGVTYYLTITKSGLTVRCQIYTTDFDTGLVDTLEGTLTKSETYRYVLACATSNYPRTYQQTADIANLQLGGTTPQTGNLFVRGYADGNPVAFTAYHVGPSGTSPYVSVPTSGYTWLGVTPGAYTVYGTYQQMQTTQSANVLAGQTASASLTFSGTPVAYTLTVKAKCPSGSSWVDLSGVPVTIAGQSQQYTPATYSMASGTYTLTVPSTHGAYNFYQWENGNTATSRTISLTQNTEVTAYYRTADTPPPPPPTTPDFLAILKAILSDPAVKAILTFTGVGCLGIGFIGLVPKKKQHQYPFIPY